MLGKAVGKDARSGKRTAAAMGIEDGRAMARDFTRQAVAALEPLGAGIRKLCMLAEMLAERKH